MEGEHKSYLRVRPIGALETLGDALTAVFDEEMARWRGAAQAYCATLRDETQRCRPPLRAAMANDTIVPEAEKDAVCGNDSVSRSGGATVSPLQSDGSACGDERDELTLDEKWAELETVLASIRRPSHSRKQPGTVTTQSRQRTRFLQHENGGWRRQTDNRQRALLAAHGISGTAADRQELCKRILDAWAEATQANLTKKANYHSTSLHWRRSRCVYVLKAWRSYCLHHGAVHERYRLVTRMIRSHHQQTTLQRWWIAARWKRAYHKLKNWADTRRLAWTVRVWWELIETVRSIHCLTGRARRRKAQGVFAAWRTYSIACHVRQEQYQRIRLLTLCRSFSALTHGTKLLRDRRVRVLKHHRQRARTIQRRVFETWILYNESKQNITTAIAWRRHCLLSASFEAWNLLHRCFAYHRQMTNSAQSHNASRLTTRCFVKWQTLIVLRRMQREAIKKLTKQLLLRACFRHLQSVVHADRSRVHQLLVWKLGRCVTLWHRQTHDRIVLVVRRRAVQTRRRRSVLRCMVWTPWRDAYLFRLQMKRFMGMAQHRVLQKWWRRWRAYESRKRTEQAMVQFIDDRWTHKQQRHAIKKWKSFRIRHTTWRAKLAVGTQLCSFTLLNRSLRRWKLWFNRLHETRCLDATAQRLYGRLVLQRWRFRAHAEKRKNELSVVQLLYRRPMWLLRSGCATWRRHVITRIRARQLRLLSVWREQAFRLAQLREAQTLSRWMKSRRLWVHWAEYTITRRRTRNASQQLLLQTRHLILAHCFNEKWRAKAIRFSTARHTLQGISMITTKQRFLRRWRQRVADAAHSRTAVAHYRCVLRHQYFQRLHHYVIVRPQAFRRARLLRNQSQLFYAWKRQFEIHRIQRHLCAQLDCWKKRQVIQRLYARVSKRHRIEQQGDQAIAFHRRLVLVHCMKRWVLFTISRSHCRTAARRLRQQQLTQVCTKWRRALAQHLFVRGLEQQYDAAWLRRCWSRFRLTVHHRQKARAVWLASLRTLRMRAVLFRWRQLVVAQQLQRGTADWRFVRIQQRRQHVALDEWTHFTMVRAFVTRHQLREKQMIQARILHQWKRYVVLAWRRRRCDQRNAARTFTAWKQHALRHAAARVIQRKRQQLAMNAMWTTWRLEFWIRQSHATARSETLRHCLDTWRLGLPKNGASNSTTRRRRATAFNEALVLHHVARQQRLIARHVLHEWASAVQKCKRRRHKQWVSRRRISVMDMPMNSSMDMAFRGREDRENIDPNATWVAAVSPPSSQPMRRDSTNLVALEFWSTRLLEEVFHGWRSTVKTQ